jgi:crossover junction endodeoxyribonuclease RusA
MFDVEGVPGSQGSKSLMPNGAMVEGSSKKGRDTLKSWRLAVAQTARQLADDTPYEGALVLDIEFRFAMPDSRSKTVKALGDVPKITTPDWDKLARATCDALVAGGLIRDDRYICDAHIRKREVVGWTGATITLRREDGQ